MKKISIFLPVLFTVFITVIAIAAAAQNKPRQDTSYYSTYPSKITARFYFSKKYTAFNIPANSSAEDALYRANTPLTMGVGATYSNLSLNLSYGFGFLNHDEDKGKTKSIDLQFHFYPKNWAIDFIAGHHEGLYIDPKGYAAKDGSSYYYRPDAKLMLGGIGAYRVANGEKFSYNAAMIQSEWQKKSAGSLLYGGQAFYGSIQADSNLVPAQVSDNFKQAGINRVDFFTAGIGAGYAYSFVIHQHFYITGSVVGNLEVNTSSEEKNGVHYKKTGVSPAGIYKAAVGYNTNSWCISANWAAGDLFINGASAPDLYGMHTGNYRLIFAKRLNVFKQSKADQPQRF